MAWVNAALLLIIMGIWLDLTLQVWRSGHNHPHDYVRRVRRLVSTLGMTLAAALVYNLALLLERQFGLPLAAWLRDVRYTALIYLVFTVASVQLWIIVRREGLRPLDRLFGQIYRLREAARRDSLTRLLHHDAFYRELARVIHRRQYPYTVMVMDVDNFREYNNEFGHPTGDDVLRAVAAVLRRELRQTDIIGRIGGEEFAIILPDTPEPLGHSIAERLRAAVEQTEVAGRPVTVSVGVVCCSGHEQVPTPRALIEAADRAMCAAKRGGKNRVVPGSCAV